MEKGYFKDLFFIESSYEVEMSQERYMGAWRSVLAYVGGCK